MGSRSDNFTSQLLCCNGSTVTVIIYDYCGSNNSSGSRKNASFVSAETNQVQLWIVRTTVTSTMTTMRGATPTSTETQNKGRPRFPSEENLEASLLEHSGALSTKIVPCENNMEVQDHNGSKRSPQSQYLEHTGLCDPTGIASRPTNNKIQVVVLDESLLISMNSFIPNQPNSPTWSIGEYSTYFLCAG